MLATLGAIAIITLLVGINSLYVASEFSAVKSRRSRLSAMASSGNALARILLPLTEPGERLDDYVAACQVGITISSISLGAYGQRVLAVELAGPFARLLERLNIGLEPGLAAEATALSFMVWLVLAVLTALQVVIGELFPKSVAVQHPERVALATLPPMRLSVVLYRPIVWLLNGSGRLVLRLLGIGHVSEGHAHSPEEIEILVTESTAGGVLQDEERQMLRNAFRLRDLTARQVMAHRTRLVAAPVDSKVDALLQLCLDSGKTRIPLYDGTIDHIEGIAHVKDLFRLHEEGVSDPRQALRPVAMVPETQPVVDVWETLKNTGQYMVIVFDEYGGTAGIITLEDLIEEIFGELQDEFDDEIAVINVDSSGGRTYLRGDLLITDVNEYLDLNLPHSGAETLSGLIFSQLGRPPREGEEVQVDGILIRVERMADLGVDEISLPKSVGPVLRIPEWEDAGEEAAVETPASQAEVKTDA